MFIFEMLQVLALPWQVWAGIAFFTAVFAIGLPLLFHEKREKVRYEDAAVAALTVMHAVHPRWFAAVGIRTDRYEGYIVELQVFADAPPVHVPWRVNCVTVEVKRVEVPSFKR